ncbi:TetR/AcrR family transcriptional regulator C-terminal domain-containing protein [Christensenellaceae bacterium OttesenSCG-928-K19]|nr:TetR/AcrR family transcriptional regulator C-terminal domain-containing protein [Christensenellaceae bacterium OttesenSCG-928-K19]
MKGATENGVVTVAESNITKAALAGALKELMISMPFKKITVNNICSKCNMSRATFYYHFLDKYELLTWIFSTETARVLKRLPKAKTWRRIEKLCEYLYENREFYVSALELDGQNSLREYFRGWLKKQMYHLLKDVIHDKINRELYTDYCSAGVIYTIEEWLKHYPRLAPADFVQRLKMIDPNVYIKRKAPTGL